MADIPQEVREAAAALAEAAFNAFQDGDYASVVMYLGERDNAMFLAGKRAGMERAAEIADDHGTAWGLAGGTSATVIAQAIRSENVNVFPTTNDEDFAERAKRLSEICGQEE